MADKMTLRVLSHLGGGRHTRFGELVRNGVKGMVICCERTMSVRDRDSGMHSECTSEIGVGCLELQ